MTSGDNTIAALLPYSLQIPQMALLRTAVPRWPIAWPVSLALEWPLSTLFQDQTSIIPGTKETEAGGSLEPSSGPSWVRPQKQNSPELNGHLKIFPAPYRHWSPSEAFLAFLRYFSPCFSLVKVSFAGCGSLGHPLLGFSRSSTRLQEQFLRCLLIVK